MKIKEYKTIRSRHTEIFDEKINESLKSGFTLYKDRFISQNEYCHQMVKYEEEIKHEKKLVDFDITWHHSDPSREARAQHMLSEGWEVFKISDHPHNDLMNYKLMLVKYE